MNALIAHADLPMLITGDVSLTQAIDFEKPFFYEAPRWKVAHISRLQEEFLKSKSRGELFWRNTSDFADPMNQAAREMAQRIFDPLKNQALIDTVRELREKLILSIFSSRRE